MLEVEQGAHCNLGWVIGFGNREQWNVWCVMGSKAQGTPWLFGRESKGTPMIWEEDYSVGN